MGLHDSDKLSSRNSEMIKPSKAKKPMTEISKERYEEGIIEKIVLGSIMLFREIELDELLKIVNEALNSLKYSLNQTNLVEILNKQYSNNQLKLYFPSPSWIGIKSGPLIKINYMYEIDYGSNIDIVPLFFGFLKLNRTINLKDFLKELQIHDPSLELGDLLRFLSLAVSNGLMQGTIFEKSLNVKVLTIQDLELDLFDFNNRILYGMFASVKQVTIKKISEVLNITKKEAENAVYNFINLTEIVGEITRGGDVLIGNLPDIPPLIQIQKLNPITREIFGYLIGNQTSDEREMQKIWYNSSNVIQQDIFELIGFGVLKAKIDKNKIKLVKHIQSKSIKPLDELILDNKNVLIKIYSELKEAEEVSLTDLAMNLKVTRVVIIRGISLLIGDGYLPFGRFDNAVFKVGDLQEPLRLNYCFSCKEKLGENEKICTSCGTMRHFCGVCKGILSDSDDILICPHCSNPSHETHIVAWLQIREICPNCRKNMNLKELRGR